MLRPLDGLEVNGLLHKLPSDKQQGSMGNTHMIRSSKAGDKAQETQGMGLW